MKRFIALTFLFSLLLLSQTASIWASDPNCITKEELALYNALMAYRKSKGLPQIALSKSLTRVAKAHSDEVLSKKLPNPTHDWSGCKLSEDYNCMWQKPKTMANFSGFGFEISWGGTGTKWATTDVLASWKSSPAHNAVIVEEGTWTDYNWQSVGVSFVKEHGNANANVWFAAEADVTGPPRECGTIPPTNLTEGPPPVPAKKYGQWIKVVNNHPSDLTVWIDAFDPTKGNWTGELEYTIKGKFHTYLAIGEVKVIATKLRIWASAKDGSGDWLRDKDTPQELNEPYTTDPGTYTYTFDPPLPPIGDGKQRERELKVINNTGHDIEVSVRWMTLKDGEWVWEDTMVFPFAKGKTGYLLKNDVPIHGKFAYIWADDKKGDRVWHRDKELHLDIGEEYEDTKLGTFTYTFNP